MKVLDLFSGIGGFSLGLEIAGMETVAFCEVNEFCRKVLRKHWPDVPIFEDVRTLRGEDVGTINLICGGYPCQPFSLAGERRGQDDDRHLWPEMFRLLQETRAHWLIGENVAGHISMGLDKVLSDLEGEGYATQAFVIPACALDAPHRRDRVWIVANARGEQYQSSCHAEQWQRAKKLFEASLADTNSRMFQTGGEHAGRQERCISDKQDPPAGPMGNPNSLSPQRSRTSGLQELETRHEQRELKSTGNGARQQWATEPAVGRVANGIPSRVDRLRALGNAVVPQIPEILGHAIMAIDELEHTGDSRCAGMTHG